MSKNFNKFKTYYDKKYWTAEMLQNVVGKPLGITQEEYNQIVGDAQPEM